MADRAPADLSLNPIFVALVASFLGAVGTHGIQLLTTGAAAISFSGAGAAVSALIAYVYTLRRARA